MRNKTKEELIEICKVNNITGYSKFGKDDLQDYIRMELAKQQYDMNMEMIHQSAKNEKDKCRLAMKYFRKLEQTKYLNLKIKDYNIGRTKFEGVYIKSGTNLARTNNSKTILVINIKDSKTRERVLPSAWFTLKPSMNIGLKSGDRIIFTARTNKEKRTVRGRSLVRYAFNDYRLAEIEDFEKLNESHFKK